MAKKKTPAKNPVGRPRGTVMEVVKKSKERIDKADPIGFLIKAMKGEAIDGSDPLTYKERVDVAMFLTKKLVPDMKSLTSDGEGGNITITVNTGIERTPDGRTIDG